MWTECRANRPCENGHVIAEKGGEKAPTNHLASRSKNRKNASVRLTGHTARRNCGKRDEVLWDSELPGFGLRFRPPNGKIWIVRFRERKIARTISLGPVSEIDAEADLAMPVAMIRLLIYTGARRAEIAGLRRSE